MHIHTSIETHVHRPAYTYILCIFITIHTYILYGFETTEELFSFALLES